MKSRRPAEKYACIFSVCPSAFAYSFSRKKSLNVSPIQFHPRRSSHSDRRMLYMQASTMPWLLKSAWRSVPS